MDKGEAQESLKKLQATAVALEGSAVIDLFEIDVTEIALEELLYKSKHLIPINANKIFRFHNNPKLIDTSIWYNNIEYTGAPIKIDGFEISSKGTLPAPKMSITAEEASIQTFHLLKQYIRGLDSLIGAKVTRIRTFAKYLDSKNFYSTGTTPLNPDVIIPKGLDPDPNAHFPEEVYYIERKSAENKLFIEFELASSLSLEEIKLPGRTVTGNVCPWTYRGEGCCYEYRERKSAIVHGKATLPTVAPPLANEKDELIEVAIEGYKPSDYHGSPPEDWGSGKTYSKGKAVRIFVRGVGYYFVAKKPVPMDVPPPNEKYWMPDQCSKKLTGCKWRWGTYDAVTGDEGHEAGSPPVTNGSNPKKGHLPFGGFPGVISARDA